MLDVGLARAFVKSPTPPVADEAKGGLWLHQTDPLLNPNIAIVKYFNFQIGEWVALAPEYRVRVREVINVTTNGQTNFTLGQNAISPQLSRVQITNLPTQIYGEDYTITEDGTNYNPNSIDNNRLDFLGTEYGLLAGDKIYIEYQIS